MVESSEPSDETGGRGARPEPQLQWPMPRVPVVERTRPVPEHIEEAIKKQAS
jgi:hypothetical protein